MIFILTKLAVDNHQLKEISIYDDVRDAISNLHNSIDNLNTDEYKCEIKNDCRIEVFKTNKGYICNSSTLEFIYQITEYDD